MQASPTLFFRFFFFNDTATTEIYTLSLHDALPISIVGGPPHAGAPGDRVVGQPRRWRSEEHTSELQSRPHLVCRLLLAKKKPSQLYVFMPQNLGGFFMVRSYYHSECHADYFAFERIEALNPAIEACGISTLSQSPMLGFHKQMDNRIKLLVEILSFRMQGVEFDNGDMYVDGHKAASDVRDEVVSVTEKLMDELAQCYNVLPQLDINNTIYHRPAGDEKWFLENEKTVTQFCRKLAAERPLKDIRDEYNYPKTKGSKH